MKKIISISLASVILTGCANSCMTKSHVVENRMFDIRTQYRSIDSVAFYRNQVDSLKYEIEELEEQLDISQDLLQVKEGEISYWGHKLDSCIEILNKKKKY